MVNARTATALALVLGLCAGGAYMADAQAAGQGESGAPSGSTQAVPPAGSSNQAEFALGPTN